MNTLDLSSKEIWPRQSALRNARSAIRLCISKINELEAEASQISAAITGIHKLNAALMENDLCDLSNVLGSADEQLDPVGEFLSELARLEGQEGGEL